MTAAALIRAARLARGLSQTDLAQLSGVAGSTLSLFEHGRRSPTAATLAKVLQSARHTLIAIPTVLPDVASIADAIRTAVRDLDESLAFRLLVQEADNLAAVDGALRVGLTLAEPGTTGDRRWDAAIAAIAAWRLDESGLPRAAWIDAQSRLLSEPWQPPDGSLRIAADPDHVPFELRRRNILIESSTLRSI
ncbi:helix-turn-helix transcriptional regulator [Microbacteriaceae bacterium VKM Ac-2855]|nr:helix-turn-helix transcriptional regulator [Microbacteriaceae bacterium VKM Ac-2855]